MRARRQSSGDAMSPTYSEPAPPLMQRSSSSPGMEEKLDKKRRNALHRKVRSSNLFRITDEAPRQVTYGIVLFACLMFLASGNEYLADERPGAAFRRATMALLFFLLGYSLLNTRDGVLERPHPSVWRLLHGWNIWYCMIVVAILVVPSSDGVTLMRWLFPGVQPPEQTAKVETLGTDHLKCEMTFENFKRQLFSIWFIAHVLGWWAKMLMLRDLKTCIVYSTFFEFTELSLQFIVPEFQECWWDSVFMDWLIANTLIGMMLGKLTLSLLNVSLFDWAPDKKWIAQTWQVLTPSSWTEYSWNPANDPVTMLLNATIWLIMAVCEVNSFFLINIMHLPRDHPFNYARQALLCLTAVPAVEEWYEYTRHARASYLGREWFEYTNQFKGRYPRIGHFTWLLSMTVACETAAIVKYSLALDQWRTAKPGPEIWMPWAIAFLLFSLYFVIHCWFFNCRERRCPVWLRVLKWTSCIPLFFLTKLYAF
eukprot:TRINITY_DN72014_c0_g1_i1.p1 TRINITY_DN72014_c0_g1~~TRINITY_DN72014_c0_g1_i1.p1  ORF type:complete len:481 (-),score=50.15 TRINITY_DN72014_c0_g1_i1:107-1549(-)